MHGRALNPGDLVAVFGGTGFIGTHLCERLLAAGFEVRAAARRPEHAGIGHRDGPALEKVRASLSDEEAVRKVVDGAAAVINLVGIVTESGLQTYEAVHVGGAGRVARAARAGGAARLIHVSALGIAPDAPSAADRTKAAGEDAVRDAFPDATVLRPGLVYGPDDHFFTRFAEMARRAPVLPLIGGGRTRFQPIDIEDATATFLAALREPASRSRAYALAGPEVYSFRELIELMLAAIGLRRLLVSIPYPVAEALSTALRLLPDPPLTREQVRLLQTDKIAGPDDLLPQALGIQPRPLAPLLPRYLTR